MNRSRIGRLAGRVYFAAVLCALAPMAAAPCRADTLNTLPYQNYLYVPSGTVLADAHELLDALESARIQKDVSIYSSAQIAFQDEFVSALQRAVLTKLHQHENDPAMPDWVIEAAEQLSSTAEILTAVQNVFDGVLKYQVATTPITVCQFFARVANAQVVALQSPAVQAQGAAVPPCVGNSSPNTPSTPTAWRITDLGPGHRLGYSITLSIPGSVGPPNIPTLQGLSKYFANVIGSALMHRAELGLPAPPPRRTPAYPTATLPAFMPTLTDMFKAALADVIKSSLQSAYAILNANGTLRYGFNFDAWLNADKDFISFQPGHTQEIDVSDLRVVNVHNCPNPSASRIIDLRPGVLVGRNPVTGGVTQTIVCSVVGLSGGQTEIFADFRKQFKALAYTGSAQFSRMAIQVKPAPQAELPPVQPMPNVIGALPNLPPPPPPPPAPRLPAPAPAPGLPPLPPLPKPAAAPQLPAAKICSAQDALTDPACMPK